MPSQGQGLETTLAQVAAGELGVTPEDVTVIGGDTLGISQGIGTFASRAAVVGGSAVALAARELHAKAVRLAAHALGVAEDEIQQHGKFFAERARPERRIELGRLASAAAMATAAHGVAPGSRPRISSSRRTSPIRAARTSRWSRSIAKRRACVCSATG